MVGLVGCGQVPRPFQPEQKAPPGALTAQLGARAGVLVEPVADLDDNLATALSARIVAGLHDHEILAVTEGANRASYALEGNLGGTTPPRLSWRLTDATGIERIAFETAAPPNGEAQAIGTYIADQVAAYLLPPSENSATGPRVVVPLVDGAPGDGRHELAAAMRHSLVKSGLSVSEVVVDDAYLVLGSVFTAPASETEQLVEITWTLMRPDGSRIGSVDQQNTVPVGALDGRWGPVARIIADYGAQGIASMLEKLAAAQ